MKLQRQWYESCVLFVEGDKLYAEGGKLCYAGRDKLHAEARKLWAEARKQFEAAVRAEYGDVQVTWGRNYDCDLPNGDHYKVSEPL